ncbi:integrase, catalytic region, zinc finger, CCHC-type containing protein [Tanacetum coccineum]
MERILLLSNGFWKNKCVLKILWSKQNSLMAQGNRQKKVLILKSPFSHDARLEAVRMLKKALYSLKQAPRAWYDKLSSFLIQHGFTKETWIRLIFSSMSTPMETVRLDADLQGTPTDQTTYHRMIGGLMYLTASRPDITYATFDVNMTNNSTSRGFQFLADVHPDELCLPNKRYDLMDANKKVDLEHVQCSPESKILTNIIKNHPLRFSIAASSSVPWIYMAQFWHTLKVDGSKYRLKFMLDKKELTLTLDDFRTIFHLPQATDNNHNSFVPPLSFSDMVPFYKQVLGFTMKMKTSSSFKTTSLLQPWQTLCKIFFKCLTTRVTGWDQPPLQIMQMMYCFMNNIHVDYAELLWEGLYYMLHHPTSSIPYPRFTKIIDHNLKDEDIIEKYLLSSEEQRTEISSDSVIADRVYKERIGTPSAQVSLAEHKSREEQEARENVELVNKHLASVEIEKMVEGPENVIDDRVTGYLFEHLRAKFLSRKSFDTLADHFPRNKRLKSYPLALRHSQWLALQMKFETFQVPQTTCRTSAVRPRDQDDPHDDAHPRGRIGAKRQKTSEYKAKCTSESASG